MLMGPVGKQASTRRASVLNDRRQGYVCLTSAFELASPIPANSLAPGGRDEAVSQSGPLRRYAPL